MLLAERIERPVSLFGPPETEAGPRLPADAAARAHGDDLSGRLTLDDAIVGAWEGLVAQVVVACPLCGGALQPHGAQVAAGGRCGTCGTTLD